MLERFGIVKTMIAVCALASCHEQKSGHGCVIPPADLHIVWPLRTDSIHIFDETGVQQDYGVRIESTPADSQTYIIVPGNSLVGALPFPMMLSDGERLIVLEGDLYSTSCGSDCTCYRYSGLRGEGILSVDSAGDGYHVRIDPAMAAK